ncbi:hypothetical protein EVAR_78473_1 [Eumeta japonica]|uniref:Uncharacterized protein n=1 Tax=Eumeta variegata TaxID=151549 RepID=A0A4C1TYW0_EUMVA|nr:hypothetical protein EVAR_78473_1 [Eumeta japonica]
MDPVTSGFPPKKPKRHPTFLKPYPQTRLSRFMMPQQAGESYLKPSITSQGAVVEKPDKAAAPVATKNTHKKKSDESEVTTPRTFAPRGPKPPPVFVQNKDRWTELSRKCAEKNIQLSVSLGVPREIPHEVVKEDLRFQNLPVQSVRRIGNYGIAQCTCNKNTDGPPACVLCKQKGHGQLPKMPSFSETSNRGVRAAPSAHARGLSHIKLRPCSGGITGSRPQ